MWLSHDAGLEVCQAFPCRCDPADAEQCSKTERKVCAVFGSRNVLAVMIHNIIIIMDSQSFLNLYIDQVLHSLLPRPKPPCGEEGAVTFECFLAITWSSFRWSYVIHMVCVCMGIANVARIQAQIPAIWLLTRKQDCWFSTTKKILKCHQIPLLVRGSRLGTRLMENLE